VAQAAPVKDIRRGSSGVVIEERAPGSFIEASLELWDCAGKREDKPLAPLHAPAWLPSRRNETEFKSSNDNARDGREI
jgi:hypothetical protein